MGLIANEFVDNSHVAVQKHHSFLLGSELHYWCRQICECDPEPFFGNVREEKQPLSYFKVLLDVDFKRGSHVHAASFLGWSFWCNSVMCFLT